MGFSPHGFEPWLSQTNDLKIDTYCFLARRSALLRLDKNCQCKDNVTESSPGAVDLSPNGAALE